MSYVTVVMHFFEVRENSQPSVTKNASWHHLVKVDLSFESIYTIQTKDLSTTEPIYLPLFNDEEVAKSIVKRYGRVDPTKAIVQSVFVGYKNPNSVFLMAGFDVCDTIIRHMDESKTEPSYNVLMQALSESNGMTHLRAPQRFTQEDKIHSMAGIIRSEQLLNGCQPNGKYIIIPDNLTLAAYIKMVAAKTSDVGFVRQFTSEKAPKVLCLPQRETIALSRRMFDVVVRHVPYDDLTKSGVRITLAPTQNETLPKAVSIMFSLKFRITATFYKTTIENSVFITNESSGVFPKDIRWVDALDMVRMDTDSDATMDDI